MHNERVIWVYNSGVVRFGAPLLIFCYLFESESIFSVRKKCGIYWILILRDFHGEWNENKPAICVWLLKIALFIFIIGVFCIEWNQKLRLNIRDNTHSFNDDQLCTTNLNYWWRQNLLHSDRQNSNLEAVTVDINSMTIIVDITRFFLQNIYKYIEQFVCAIVNLTKCGIYF